MTPRTCSSRAWKYRRHKCVYCNREICVTEWGYFWQHGPKGNPCKGSWLHHATHKRY